MKQIKKITNKKQIFTLAAFIVFCAMGVISFYIYTTFVNLNKKINSELKEQALLKQTLEKTKQELATVKADDQYVKNKTLQENIGNIETTYKKAVSTYEDLLDLKEDTKKTEELDKLYAASLTYLSQRNYASAQASLAQLQKQIDAEKAKLTSGFSIPKNIVSSNTPPSSGFSQQQVQSEAGTFLVYIVSADLASTKVIVDTASDSDCKDNCPVLSLADYVSRSGAYAGINGSYFCPTAYPSCTGKTNSFDLLAMNKNKVYFNSDNNVYSTNPAVIFLNGSVRFVSQALGWGRDTSADGVLSNFPMLVSGNNVVYSDNPDPKFNGKGARTFVANKGNTVYIGAVMNATMKEGAQVLKTLGMDNAMNLDQGGSTALWFNGYKLGPGRNIPNAILFVKK